METVPVQAAGSLSGNLLLYSKPELLSKELHSELGVDVAPNRFAFASHLHVCPVTVTEFGPAGLSYPIIFAGELYMPVVVMGLTENQNLYATPETGFEVDTYVPTYVRRYPFVLAQNEQAEGNERMLVGIDRAYEYIREGGQFRFFENGEPSEYTRNCIQFCNDFETQHQMTLSFVKLLQDLDLFDTRTASYQPSNPDGTPADPITLAQYFAVSETKLLALPAEKLAELRDNGALMQIYAHLQSLFGWERLMLRAMARQQEQQPQAANN